MNTLSKPIGIADFHHPQPKKSFRKDFIENLLKKNFYSFKFQRIKTAKFSKFPKIHKKKDLYKFQNIIPCHTTKFYNAVAGIKRRGIVRHSEI